MRTIAYIPLMYGAEYLSCAIQSIHHHVEEIHIVYTDKPSQGYRTNIPCPETEEQLKQIAFAASDKIIWHKSNFNNEGEHRSYIMKYTAGFDLCLTVDADEVVEEISLRYALQFAMQSDKRYLGINGFLNFWRSFNFVCVDEFRPVRIINLRNPSGQGEIPLTIYHFSCAQREEIVRYKWNVSGHKTELRPGWIDDIYLAWTPENRITTLHPVALNIWSEATAFDKNTLPECLKGHVNFNKELI